MSQYFIVLQSVKYLKVHINRRASFRYHNILSHSIQDNQESVLTGEHCSDTITSYHVTRCEPFVHLS
jgi:hypothetical protein